MTDIFDAKAEAQRLFKWLEAKCEGDVAKMREVLRICETEGDYLRALAIQERRRQMTAVPDRSDVAPDVAPVPQTKSKK